jgi:DNA (cytosine-5)-methyltransferase 1
LIDCVRELLIATGKPYVIENVMGAKKAMVNPLMLCGTMFGLNVIRHRLFECYPPIYFPPMACAHQFKTAKQGYAPVRNQYHCVTGNCGGAAGARRAMGIDWMPRDSLAQAIPPAYTEFIGRFLMEVNHEAT